MSELIRAEKLVQEFAVRRTLLGRGPSRLRALDGVDFVVREHECVAVVGESGSGKTTLGRILARLLLPTAGRVLFHGEDLAGLEGSRLRRRRRDFQMVFQDPSGSLNPRMRVGNALREPLEAHGLARGPAAARRVDELLDLVGLPAATAQRYPHQLSGGQRQRVAIARALAPEPQLLIADEPVSALDVSVRAQILNLLADLRQRLGLALVFVSHDLAVVERIADRVCVLYLGRIVETAPTRNLFAQPMHPYTLELLRSIPVPDPLRRDLGSAALEAEPASPAQPPPGCAYHPRCPRAEERCRRETPALRPLAPLREGACHFPAGAGNSRSESDE